LPKIKGLPSLVYTKVGTFMRNYTKPPFNIKYQGVVIFRVDTCDFQKIKCPTYDIQYDFLKMKYPVLIYNRGFQYLEKIK
jgi:hypothetical protein